MLSRQCGGEEMHRSLGVLLRYPPDTSWRASCLSRSSASRASLDLSKLDAK